MRYVVPHMLVDGDREAMDFAMTPGSYDSTLTGDAQYKEGDLVIVNAGKVSRAVSATAATLAAQELFLAGADWSQPFAKQYLLDTGVPLNVIPQRNLFVMTYRGNAAAGADYTFLAADLQAVQAHARREIAFDTVEKCLVITSGTSNPKVTLQRMFRGAVGDTNVQIVVKLDTGTGA